MGNRPENPFRMCTSEDKTCRKDLCGYVRTIYILEKLQDVSGSGLIEAGRYKFQSILAGHIVPPDVPGEEPKLGTVNRAGPLLTRSLRDIAKQVPPLSLVSTLVSTSGISIDFVPASFDSTDYIYIYTHTKISQPL
jgi:hypothetical protein